MAGGIRSYSTSPSSNNAASPFGFPEDMVASGVNDSARQTMADIRTWYEDAQWIDFGHTPTRTGNTTFTVPTDVTAIYLVGRRVKVTGSATAYSTITSSVFGAVTTVTVVNDSGNLPATLTTVSVGVLTQSNSSIPSTILFSDGTAAAPPMSFSADTNTGPYRIGADNLGIAAGGLKVADLKFISGSDAQVAIPAGFYTPTVAIAFNATTMTIPCGQGNVFSTTLTANVTAINTPTNMSDGQTITWFLTQDGTGSRTMTWPTGFKWPGGTVGVLTTTANAVDMMTATFRNSVWYAQLVKDLK